MTVKGKLTRAELLREKRERQPRKRTSQTKRQKRSTPVENFPPVLVRGMASASFSPGKKKSRKSRRRFDIALNGQGAEMRLPSIPSIGIGWRVASVLLIGVLGFLIYFMWSSSLFQVEKIDVTGLGRLSSEDLNLVADVVGKSIILVDPQKIEQELAMAFPELERVSVDTEVPNKVMAKIVERQPVIAWQQDGQTFWIDETGAAYQPHGEDAPSIQVQGSDLLTLPSADSELLEDKESSNQSLPADLIKGIQILSQKIPEGSLITYDSEHGLGWFDSRGWQVYFGTGGDEMEIKWKVYWKTFKRLKQAGIQPALISVEHVHAPYYRLER